MLWEKTEIKILIILISSLSFINKNLTISILSFSTALNKAVLSNNIWNMIEIYYNEFHWKYLNFEWNKYKPIKITSKCTIFNSIKL